jgi:hypothetical protein
MSHQSDRTSSPNLSHTRTHTFTTVLARTRGPVTALLNSASLSVALRVALRGALRGTRAAASRAFAHRLFSGAVLQRKKRSKLRVQLLPLEALPLQESLASRSVVVSLGSGSRRGRLLLVHIRLWRRSLERRSLRRRQRQQPDALVGPAFCRSACGQQ